MSPPYVSVNGNNGVTYYAADGETEGLIEAALWVDVATVKVQEPSERR